MIPATIQLAPLLILIGLILTVFLFAITVATRYRKTAPNQAIIISGAWGVRIITGGSTFVWPVLERMDSLSLEPFGVPFSMPNGMDALATLKVGNTEEDIANAANNFLSKSPEQMTQIVGEIFEHHLRSGPEEKAKEAARSQLSGMGLELITLNVKE